MIDKSKLQEDSHINIDFNQNPIRIKKTKDGKWMFLVGCTQYAFKLNTWEEVILQLSSIFLDPEKFYIENKIELGNRKLKEVDLHVITKHIEDQLNNDQ
jgi:hypothetical protein